MIFMVGIVGSILVVVGQGILTSYHQLFETAIQRNDGSTISRLISYDKGFSAATQNGMSFLFGNPHYDYFSESDLLTMISMTGILGFLLFYWPQIAGVISLYTNRVYGKMNWFYHSVFAATFAYLLYSVINPVYQNMIVSTIGAFLLGQAVRRKDLFRRTAVAVKAKRGIA